MGGVEYKTKSNLTLLKYFFMPLINRGSTKSVEIPLAIKLGTLLILGVLILRIFTPLTVLTYVVLSLSEQGVAKYTL